VKPRQVYESICEVRKDSGLGCRGCILRGCKECPVYNGVLACQSLTQLRNVYRGRSRGERGYELHLR